MYTSGHKPTLSLQNARKNYSMCFILIELQLFEQKHQKLSGIWVLTKNWFRGKLSFGREGDKLVMRANFFFFLLEAAFSKGVRVLGIFLTGGLCQGFFFCGGLWTEYSSLDHLSPQVCCQRHACSVYTNPIGPVLPGTLAISYE